MTSDECVNPPVHPRQPLSVDLIPVIRVGSPKEGYLWLTLGECQLILCQLIASENIIIDLGDGYGPLTDQEVVLERCGPAHIILRCLRPQTPQESNGRVT